MTALFMADKFLILLKFIQDSQAKYKLHLNIVRVGLIEIARKLGKQCPDINYETANEKYLEEEITKLKVLMKEFNQDLTIMLTKS